MVMVTKICEKCGIECVRQERSRSLCKKCNQVFNSKQFRLSKGQIRYKYYSNNKDERIKKSIDFLEFHGYTVKKR